MAFKLLARTRETTVTTGSGTTISLAGASGTDVVPFSAGLANGDTTIVCLISGDNTAWQECVVQYATSGDSLTVLTVLINNSGTTSEISLAGTSRVFAILPHDISVLFDKLFGNTRGEMLVRGASAWGVVAPGTSGQLLTFGATDPGWAAQANISRHYTAAAATTSVLPTNTYNNGTSGVGATLTGNSNGALPSIDGVSPVVGYPILVKNEATPANNGIYTITQVGDGSHPYILTRSVDYNSAANILQGDFIGIGPVGTANGTKIFITVLGASPPTLGSTSISFIHATTGQKYIVGSSVSGVLTASQQLLFHRFAVAVTIPGNFADYLGYSTQAGGSADATASTVISVNKAAAASPNSFSNVGSITIASGTVTPTFTTVSGADVNFAKGDVMEIVAPASPDATFAGFYATIVGSET